MAKKPTLTVVNPDTTGLSPPRKLGPAGAKLWAAIQSDYGIDDPGGITVLTLICEAQDRLESLGEAIARDGPTYLCRGVPKAHPALRDELATRAFIVKSLERLGINVEAVKPMGRPNQPVGWQPR